MPFLRKLLTPNESEIFQDGNETFQDYNVTIDCLNGYILENTTICICYPGWTTDNYSLTQCSVDNGENDTISYTNDKRIVRTNEGTKGNSLSAGSIVAIIMLSILALGIFAALFLWLFKKYKDIRLVKEKIKFEKKKNKNENTIHREKGKDINSSNENVNENNSVNLGVLCDSRSNSVSNDENNK